MSSELFCKNCNLQFDKKYGLYLHLSLVHEEKIEIKNEPLKCKEVFQEPQTSEKLSSDNVVDTCLKCDICNSLFKTKGKLERHIQSFHEGIKPFKCIICDVSFLQKHHLNTHKVSVCEGKKPFKCYICDACFTRNGDLNRHVASVHEGKKPFKCSICATRFARKTHLNAHLEQLIKDRILQM